VTWGDPDESGIEAGSGIDMYYMPELSLPIASILAHKQHTLFAKPVKETLARAIQGADAVHVYEPWPLGSAAQRVAKRLHVPVMAAFHTQPENITYNIGLGWFPLAAHVVYFMMYLFFYRRFSHIHCPSKFIAAQLRRHGYKAWLHVISNGVHPDFRPPECPQKRDKDIFRILMVGRLSPEKRQDVLIRAVRMSKYAGHIQLYFAGQGPWEKRLRRMGDTLPHPPIFGTCRLPTPQPMLWCCLPLAMRPGGWSPMRHWPAADVWYFPT
jgi:glycosyltransferase involved in cell wall biosynthesis